MSVKSRLKEQKKTKKNKKLKHTQLQNSSPFEVIATPIVRDRKELKVHVDSGSIFVLSGDLVRLTFEIVVELIAEIMKAK